MATNGQLHTALLSLRRLAVAVLIATTSIARAIVLTLEDLPGDIHEGSSVASEYDQYIHLNVSGFGGSKVTINVTVNDSGSLSDTGLIGAGTLNAPNWMFPGFAIMVADPTEFRWMNSFVGPASVSVTFQANDDFGDRSAALTRNFIIRGIGVPPPNPHAAIERNPELKSRAVAWTAYDGAYRFDTLSRAEMLDVFWNIFNQPYGDHGWTGSVNPPAPGTTSERWRVRAYAQLNAYRWLNRTAPVSEDPDKLDFMQAAPLVFAQNIGMPITHAIPLSYVGYNTTAAFAATQSLLDAGDGDHLENQVPFGGIGGVVDLFIDDADPENAGAVGHRTNLLHNNSTLAAVGSAKFPGSEGYANAWWTPFVEEIDAPREKFIAYPSQGYFPIPMVPNRDFHWSFVTANDLTQCTPTTSGVTADPGVPLKDASVTAKINGVDALVNNLVRGNAPGPLTWDFGSALNVDNGIADGTVVEITIHDVAMMDETMFHVIGYRDYQYTVTLFDPTTIASAGFSPKTPLTNISTRSVIGGGDQQMIAGFTVSGTEPARIAVRTQGPGLTRFGIKNAAKSTHIRVYDQATGTSMGENTGWKNHPSWRLLQSLNVAPSQDSEAAEVLTLWPGSYTAVVSDDTGSGGVGIVEAFDIDNLSEARLVNLSTRGVVGNDENQMIAGMSVSGSERTLVIRTQGPGLARFGVANAVKDTFLKIVAQSDGHTVAQNDDWQMEPANARLTADLASYAPSDPHEAALVLTLQPGAYTALVSTKGVPGVGIVEVFDVTPKASRTAPHISEALHFTTAGLPPRSPP